MPSAEPIPVDLGADEITERGHGSETILLADDETGVRRFARRALEDCGFAVLEARDGKEAVALFDSHRDEVSLVFLDLTMPRLGGIEALEQIRALNPSVPALLTSGNPQEQVVSRTRGSQFLHKPYTLDALTARVRAILDAKSNNSDSSGD